MDIDAFVAVHRPEWIRLGRLVERASRPKKMSGEELDELVELYQRTATHLSVIRGSSFDQTLVDNLASLVTRARAVVAGTPGPGWKVAGRFFTVTFPAAVYVRRWWVIGTTVGCLVISFAAALWVLNNPTVYGALIPPDDVRALCDSEFASYYSENPASSFASLVWTNNAWVSAQAITFGVLLGLPTLAVLLINAMNLGVVGGYMSSCGETEQFFSLILPHGLLELTVVFVAGAVGLRLGWSVIDPGGRRRTEALAAEGRSAIVIAFGLAAALAISGVIEAYVTPSSLPTAVRIGIGALAWAAFVAYIWIYGYRAVAAAHDERGDLDATLSTDLAPVSA